MIINEADVYSSIWRNREGDEIEIFVNECGFIARGKDGTSHIKMLAASFKQDFAERLALYYGEYADDPAEEMTRAK